MKSKSTNDPIAVARTLRARFEREIPKTWDEYYQRGRGINWHQMTLLILEQTKGDLTYQDAAALCAQVNPELFGDYWEHLAKTGQG